MKTRATMVGLIITTCISVLLFVPRLAGAYLRVPRPGNGDQALKIQIPAPLRREHEELHAELARATQAGGKTGAAAQEVARILHPHFVKEEEFALPPLGLLPDLARGKVTLGMRAVLPMTDQLKVELPQMLEEHQAIVAALKRLIEAAKAEQKPEYARFADKLILHAQTEEQVTYPTAILIGEYLQWKIHLDRPSERAAR